jgi:hypothetical protein
LKIAKAIKEANMNVLRSTDLNLFRLLKSSNEIINRLPRDAKENEHECPLFLETFLRDCMIS